MPDIRTVDKETLPELEDLPEGPLTFLRVGDVAVEVQYDPEGFSPEELCRRMLEAGT